jgi:2-dehydropantoate 2-reductase
MAESWPGNMKNLRSTKSSLLPADVVDKTIEVISRFPYDTKISMQIDRERGNRTEIDIFTDYIRQSGLELGIPTPLHDEIYNQLLNL